MHLARFPRARFAHLPTPLEERRALFIARWLTESLLEFKEFAQGKFKRGDLVSLVERLEERLLAGQRLRLQGSLTN